MKCNIMASWSAICMQINWPFLLAGKKHIHFSWYQYPNAKENPPKDKNSPFSDAEGHDALIGELTETVSCNDPSLNQWHLDQQIQ